MSKRSLFFLLILLVSTVSGCAANISEVITSEPFGAEIYWGKSKFDLKRAGYKTTYSRNMSGSRLEKRCYQVKKEGYHYSKVICRSERGSYRHVYFQLDPVRTVISSDPPGADIYWGPSIGQLEQTIHKTPWTEKNVRVGASYKDWYFQIKKEGFYDSKIVFRSQSSNDRLVKFKLKPLNKSDTTSIRQVKLAWEDNSDNELSFKIERKTGSSGTYKEIATVGPNVTNYTDTGLSASTTYFYRVRAYNLAGHSAYSNEVSFRIYSN